MRFGVIGATVVALAFCLPAAACGSGGGSGPSNVPTSCTPAGSTVPVVAKNIAFEPLVLCAPASRRFTIAFDDQDNGVPHNIQVFSDSGTTRSVFKGALISGDASIRYAVPALAAGVYHFRCDVHPGQMQGALIVSG